MASRNSEDEALSRNRSIREFISLLDDDDEAISGLSRQAHIDEECLVQSLRRQRDTSRIIATSDENDRLRQEIQQIIDADENALNEEINRIEIDLTQDHEVRNDRLGGQASIQNQPRAATRNLSLYPTHYTISSYRDERFQIKINDCLELSQAIRSWSVQFMEVKEIWHPRTSAQEVILRGLPYSRNRHLLARLERKLNEVCQVLEVDSDDQRPDERQSMIHVGLRQILTKRVLNKTNASFPKFRYGSEPQWPSQPRAIREDEGPLTCRWKMRIEYRNQRFRDSLKAYEGALVRLSEADIQDRRFLVSDRMLRQRWHGQPTPLGRPLTFADTFCGAGGATRGVEMAGGIQARFAVDSWDTACSTYSRNFPQVGILNWDIADFVTRPTCPVVDLLHISPPCQFWSPAHTREGQNDDSNIAALFACFNLVKKLRPRIVTVEQTFGLMHDRHSLFFNSLIHNFTCSGYSVRWKLVHLVGFGLPQTRKRLIMIASGPGEQLPPWPAPTHGSTPGLKPLVTEGEAISHISPRATLHDVATARMRHAASRQNSRVHRHRSGNIPLSRTITCSGSDFIHYSGTREYTLRELARLQGFPDCHVFEGRLGEIKKQIGNAFPPCVVNTFYQHLRDCLLQSDRRERDLAASALHSASLNPFLPGSFANYGNGQGSAAHAAISARAGNEHSSMQYGDYNAGYDAEEALRRALSESRAEVPRRRRAVSVITVLDSDDEKREVGRTTDGLDRLSIRPEQNVRGRDPRSDKSQSPRCANQDTPREKRSFSTSRDRLCAPKVRSSVSSETLESSSPSPGQPPKRKFDYVELHDDDDVLASAERKADSTSKGRAEIPDDDDGEVKILFEFTKSKRERRQVSAFGIKTDREASIPIPAEASRALSFGNKLGKLPAKTEAKDIWTL